MPIEIGLWKLKGNQAVPVQYSSLETERRLEEVLERDLSILGLDTLLVVGRQVSTPWNARIDLLAVDSQGDLFRRRGSTVTTPRRIG